MRKLLAAALLALSTLPAHAGDGPTLAAGFDYSSGKYGGGEAIEMLFLPLTAKYESGPYTLKLTVPYIELSGPANVIGNTSGNMAIPLAGAGPQRTVAGLGDVQAGLGYNAYFDPDRQFALDLATRIKFATADAEKGLGTGKNDLSLQCDAYKTSGDTTFMASLGYKWTGKPAGSDYRNVAYASVGLQHRFGGDFSAGILWDVRQSVLSTLSDQREITLHFTRGLAPHWKALAYLYAGTTPSSPNAGLGASLNHDF